MALNTIAVNGPPMRQLWYRTEGEQFHEAFLLKHTMWQVRWGIKRAQMGADARLDAQNIFKIGTTGNALRVLKYKSTGSTGVFSDGRPAIEATTVIGSWAFVALVGSFLAALPFVSRGGRNAIKKMYSPIVLGCRRLRGYVRPARRGFDVMTKNGNG